MDWRKRKLMTMYKAFHSKDEVDRLYVSRKEGGRGLTVIEDGVDASIQRLKDNIEKRGKRLITTTRFGLVSLFNGISTFVGYLMP